MGWWSTFGKQKTRKGATEPGPAVHDDPFAYEDAHGVIRRRFDVTGANELWLTHIAEDHTREAKLDVGAVKDAYSNRVVGYSMAPRMKSSLAIAALGYAIRMRGRHQGCIVRSDRGSQFRSRKYQRRLKVQDLVGLMRRVGSAGDKAAMESFFALRQNNILDRRSWSTRDELRIAITTWIERTYHRHRRQLALGCLTPVQYELIMSTPATQAA